jgi:hypothetical protein
MITSTRSSRESARLLAARVSARARARQACGDQDTLIQDAIDMAYVIETLCDALHQAEFQAGAR